MVLSKECWCYKVCAEIRYQDEGKILNPTLGHGLSKDPSKTAHNTYIELWRLSLLYPSYTMLIMHESAVRYSRSTDGEAIRVKRTTHGWLEELTGDSLPDSHIQYKHHTIRDLSLRVCRVAQATNLYWALGLSLFATTRFFGFVFFGRNNPAFFVDHLVSDQSRATPRCTGLRDLYLDCQCQYIATPWLNQYKS